MIYVLSDIHGQKRRFESIMKQINLQPEDTLYVLGDVIDRTLHHSQDGVEREEIREWARSLGWTGRAIKPKNML